MDRIGIPDDADGGLCSCVAAQGFATLEHLQFHFLHRMSVDDEDVDHVIRQQLARVANVDGRFYSQNIAWHC